MSNLNTFWFIIVKTLAIIQKWKKYIKIKNRNFNAWIDNKANYPILMWNNKRTQMEVKWDDKSSSHDLFPFKQEKNHFTIYI